MICRLTLKRASAAAASIAALSLLAAGCGKKDSAGEGEGEGEESEATEEADVPKLTISGIPDQKVTKVSRQHQLLADYIGEATGLEVEYVPMVDYAALVTAFERGDVQLAWFGALTGVQARVLVDGSEAIVHRSRDEGFRSNYIVQADLEAESVEDLKGLSFTFGSESSTSGHLMPRYGLMQADIDPDEDFDGPPNYSGSHDKTLELVQSGAYQAGAMNEAVWEQWAEEGKLDEEKVRLLTKTEPYFNYNWSIRGGVDDVYGEGTRDKIAEALLALDIENPDHKEILDMFQAQKFVPTKNENYDDVKAVAQELGLIR
jgi:phosphonate transport system substrate-binding protein